MSIPNWYAYLPHSSSLRHNVFFPLSKTKFFFLLVATKSDLDHSCTLCLFFPSRLTCTPQNKRPSSSLAFSKDIDLLPKAPQAGRAGGRVDNWLVDWLTLSTFFPPSFQTSPSTPSQQKKHTRPLFDARVISIVPLFLFQNKNTKAKHKHCTLPLLPLPSKKRMCDHDVSRQPNPVLTGMACALFLLWRKKVFEQGGLFGNKYQGHTPQLSISVWFSGDVMLYCVVSRCSNCWLLIRPSALESSIKPRLILGVYRHDLSPSFTIHAPPIGPTFMKTCPWTRTLLVLYLIAIWGWREESSKNERSNNTTKRTRMFTLLTVQQLSIALPALATTLSLFNRKAEWKKKRQRKAVNE